VASWPSGQLDPVILDPVILDPVILAAVCEPAL